MIGAIASLLLCGVLTLALALIARQRAATPAAEPPVAAGPAESAPEGAPPESDVAPLPSPTIPAPLATAPAGDSALGDLAGRLAYIDAGLQVATIDPDGGDGRRLTDDGRVYQFPVWSPDSQQLAAIGADRSGTGVYILADRPAGSSLVRAVPFSRSEAPFYLYWAPDSRRVSILANHPSGLALHLAVAEPGVETQLLATGQPFYWAWSPSADEILMHSGANREGARLSLLDPTGGGPAPNLATPGSFQSPGISASGSRWAFTEEDDTGTRWLVVRAADGPEEARLPHTGSLALSWSPQDERLAFIAPRMGESTLYGPLRVYDTTTGQARTLSTQTVVAFFWSPDGRQIAFLTVHGRNTIEAGLAPDGAVEGRSRTRLARVAAQAEEGPELDLTVVDVASGRERFLMAFEPTSLFVSQFLPFFDQYALSHRVWSPDSRALVLPVRQEGRSQILVVPADGRSPRVVAPGAMGFWSTR